MKSNQNIDAFFAVLRAGLWERKVQLSLFGIIDYNQICHIAEYQTVTGIIAAGFEYVVDATVPRETALTLAGYSLELEKRNKAMNLFVKSLICRLRNSSINPLLVKGQGIAQCYERPLWRVSGDVDLLLCDKGYKNALEQLKPYATSVEDEDSYKKHIALKIDTWLVELHGNLRSRLSYRIDKMMDTLFFDSVVDGNVRQISICDEKIKLLGIDNDLLYVFVHILQHFFHGGIGLRQICDWCRLLWYYREEIDIPLLENRLRSMRLMSEWKAFSAFAVDSLGIPLNGMILYDDNKKWKHKALRIKEYVIKSGNFGHRDLKYVNEYSFILRKLRSLFNMVGEMFTHIRVFPFDSVRFFLYSFCVRLKALIRGE